MIQYTLFSNALESSKVIVYRDYMLTIIKVLYLKTFVNNNFQLTIFMVICKVFCPPKNLKTNLTC